MVVSNIERREEGTATGFPSRRSKIRIDPPGIEEDVQERDGLPGRPCRGKAVTCARERLPAK
jgi:hypothetical protein